MAKHEGTSQQKKEKVDQKHHAIKQKESQSSFDQLHVWEQGIIPTVETPFAPRMDEHAELLATAPSDEHRANLVLHLQQTYGNRYVQRLIESTGVQAKLTVSNPGDVYEQEADRVATAVTRTIDTQLQRQAEEEEELQTKASLVQRQAEEEEELQTKASLVQRQAEEEEELQTKASLVQRQAEEEEELQTKASLVQRQAEEEEEIQTKASLVQRQPEEEEEIQAEVAKIQRQNLADSPEHAWRGSDAPEWYEYDRLLKIARDKYPDMTMEIVERDEFGQPACWHVTLIPGMNSEELTRDNILHWMARFTGQTVRTPPDFTQPTSPNFEPGWRERQTTVEAGAPIMEKPLAQEINEKLAVSSDIEMRISSARGGGHPLSDVVREPMEKAFGADFSSVRVHTDSAANTLNQKLSARAFTTGQDVFFREGEYSPGSGSGRTLIAHELTHVVQQDTKRKVIGEQNRLTIRNAMVQRSPALGEEAMTSLGSSTCHPATLTWLYTEASKKADTKPNATLEDIVKEGPQPVITKLANAKGKPLSVEESRKVKKTVEFGGLGGTKRETKKFKFQLYKIKDKLTKNSILYIYDNPTHSCIVIDKNKIVGHNNIGFFDEPAVAANAHSEHKTDCLKGDYTAVEISEKDAIDFIKTFVPSKKETID